jgi:ABC-type transport system involved in multi-copper enzyme maturation permease subunit
LPTFILAVKDLRLLLRDARSGIILLVMPLLFVGVLGMSVGEGFFQKPDDRLRISVVNQDEGLPADHRGYPPKPWSDVVIDDLSNTADIRIEVIPNQAEAESLIHQGKRAAILVFEPQFSREMDRCSFLTQAEPPPLNPLYANGIDVEKLGLKIIRDPTQGAAASIIEQVGQVTLLRVVIPWMIGKAFERVGDEQFMDVMVAQFRQVGGIPIQVLKELGPVLIQAMQPLFSNAKFIELLGEQLKIPALFLEAMKKDLKRNFTNFLEKTFANDAFLKEMTQKLTFADLMTPAVKKEIGPGVKKGIATLFGNYNFTAKTWTGLTKNEPQAVKTDNRTEYKPEPDGLIKRGALRYQILVPSYTVMFAFFLVLTVGWLFVAERRQGTLVRLRAAPLSRAELLLGKFLPCFVMSLFQGVFLLGAGYVIFGMSWGAEPFWLLAVVASTSLAAMGLAMLIAGVAKTETQVAVYGTLLVLILAALSGTFMPRDLMPEQMREFSYVTPHAWALDAYNQLLLSPAPDIAVVGQACGVLVAFGLGFLALAWWLIRLD